MKDLPRGFWPAFAICAALIFSFAFAHVHDWDATIYIVVSRHLAEDGKLFHLRFVPQRWAEFYDHPPFYFWLCALWLKAFGETTLPVFNGLLGCGTVLLTFLFARKIAGDRAALAAMLVLGTTESFFRYQGRTRIDVAFNLLLTASVYFLVEKRWVLGALLCLFALLTKGPPAIAAPAAAILWNRRVPWKGLLISTLVIITPLLLLFWADARYNDSAWWTHYVNGQILSSLDGRRADPGFSHWRMLEALAMRFWPGLALVPMAFFFRDLLREKLLLLAWAAIIVAGFSIPSRGYWWYITPAFVPLAIIAGVGADRLMARLPPFPTAWKILNGAAMIAILGMVVVWPRLVLAPCPVGPLPQRADALASKQGSDKPIVYVADPRDDGLEIVMYSHFLHEMTFDQALADIAIFQRSKLNDEWREVEAHGDYLLAVRK